MKPRARDFASSWLRSFAVQGTWNYQTLLGHGVAYAMLPLLRRIYAADPPALERALGRQVAPFNGHPYLCPLAVGALARLEFEGTPPDVSERFRRALTGPLGTLGDRLVWAFWRPLCLLLAVVAVLVGGLRPWIAVVGFLVLYNAGHVGLRTWALWTGWREGLGVARSLVAGPLQGGVLRRSRLVLIVLGGAMIGGAAQLVPEGGVAPWYGAACLAVSLAAFRWPLAGGKAAVGLLLAAPLLWIALGG